MYLHNSIVKVCVFQKGFLIFFTLRGTIFSLGCLLRKKLSYFPSSFNYNGLCHSSDVLQLHLPEFINPHTCYLALSKPGTEFLNIRDLKLLNAEALRMDIIIAIATNGFL